MKHFFKPLYSRILLVRYTFNRKNKRTDITNSTKKLVVKQPTKEVIATTMNVSFLFY